MLLGCETWEDFKRATKDEKKFVVKIPQKYDVFIMAGNFYFKAELSADEIEKINRELVGKEIIKVSRLADAPPG